MNMIEQLRKQTPRVHCITNYVTAGSVANFVLASGGSPIMASSVKEVEEVTAICNSLVINLGTLEEAAVPAMILAGKKAAALGHPIILDPVGAGASGFRLKTALSILSRIPVTVIRGNGTEIRILAEMGGDSCGIDAALSDRTEPGNWREKAKTAAGLAKRYGCIVAMTGELDLVTDGERICRIKNGHPWMAKITGSGCMLDGLLGVWLGAAEASSISTKSAFFITCQALSAYGIMGELAYERTKAAGGNIGVFNQAFMDAGALLKDQDLESRSKIGWGFLEEETESGDHGKSSNLLWTKERVEKALCLYGVTDRRFTRDFKEFLAQIEAGIKGGVTMIQLREKDMEFPELFKEAVEIRKLTREYGIPLIINDNLLAALACGADGLHIGQGDMEAKTARILLGRDKILGVTAKTPAQAREAEKAGADYLGSGAVFGTNTKPDAKYMTYETLYEICRSVDLPVAAIGGIDWGNIEKLKGSGIAGVAVVSGVFGKPDVEEAARQLKRKAEKLRKSKCNSSGSGKDPE